MTDFEKAVERSFERARIISNLDNIYYLKEKTIIHKENKEDNSGEIVHCLQKICSDNSEKSSKYFSDLLIGKSIVLFNQRDDKILNSKNPKTEKQKFKRNVSSSNKKIKRSKISIKKLNLSDVYILNNLWIKYINNFFKNKKLEDKNSSKLQNLELIGAVVCIVQACNKNLVGRKGVIVNRSKNCYLIAECNDDFLDPKNNWKCKIKPENGLLCHLFNVIKSEIHIGVYYPPVIRDSAVLEDKNNLFILYGQKCSNIL